MHLRAGCVVVSLLRRNLVLDEKYACLNKVFILIFTLIAGFFGLAEFSLSISHLCTHSFNAFEYFISKFGVWRSSRDVVICIKYFGFFHSVICFFFFCLAHTFIQRRWSSLNHFANIDTKSFLLVHFNSAIVFNLPLSPFHHSTRNAPFT